MRATSRAKTPKGEQTKARIVEAALNLFREHGYEATTMRAVAKEAGVALGNAYYYFRSKEHLLHAYYSRIHAAHAAASAPVLERERDLERRLLGVMKAKLEVIEPFWRFSGLLFKTAADPRSPLNPFHKHSEPTKRQGIEIFEQVLAGSRLKVPLDVARELPELLWIYSMGVILFWIHDDSPGRARTHRLVEHSCHLVARIIGVLANPLMRPLRKTTLKMLADMAAAGASEEFTAPTGAAATAP